MQQTAVTVYQHLEVLQICRASWEDSPVVVDGNLVTSRLPEDLPYFCREILKLIRKNQRDAK